MGICDVPEAECCSPHAKAYAIAFPIYDAISRRLALAFAIESDLDCNIGDTHCNIYVAICTANVTLGMGRIFYGRPKCADSLRFSTAKMWYGHCYV